MTDLAAKARKNRISVIKARKARDPLERLALQHARETVKILRPVSGTAHFRFRRKAEDTQTAGAV